MKNNIKKDKDRVTATYNKFAKIYDKEMGETGDFTHKMTINPSLFRILKEVKNMKVYDIGCGNGYISRNLVKNGAKEVWASDLSSDLIQIAQTNYDRSGIKYLIRDGSDFTNIPKGHFDFVIMSMVVHYIKDLESLFTGVNNILKVGGKIIITTDHPLKPAQHLEEGKIENQETFLKRISTYLTPKHVVYLNPWTKKKELGLYHRPLGSIINSLSAHNLLTFQIEEPKTIKESDPFLRKRIRSNIPDYIAVGAIKVTSNTKH